MKKSGSIRRLVVALIVTVIVFSGCGSLSISFSLENGNETETSAKPLPFDRPEHIPLDDVTSDSNNASVVDDATMNAQQDESTEVAVPIVPAEDRAPDFTADLAGGGTYTLSDSLGKVVILNFWATWCPPCCREMPAFQWLYEEYGDRIQIIAVDCAEYRKDVDAFIADNGYTFPIAYDEYAEICDLYPTDGIPYTLIIGKYGDIKQSFVGAYSAEEQYKEYKDAIEEAMSE